MRHCHLLSVLLASCVTLADPAPISRPIRNDSGAHRNFGLQCGVPWGRSVVYQNALYTRSCSSNSTPSIDVINQMTGSASAALTCQHDAAAGWHRLTFPSTAACVAFTNLPVCQSSVSTAVYIFGSCLLVLEKQKSSIAPTYIPVPPPSLPPYLPPSHLCVHLCRGYHISSMHVLSIETCSLLITFRIHPTGRF